MLGPAVPTSNVSGLELQCRCRSTKPVDKNILMTRSCSGSWTVGCKSGHPAKPPETSDFETSLSETLPCYGLLRVWEREELRRIGLEREELRRLGSEGEELRRIGKRGVEKAWIGRRRVEKDWIEKRGVEKAWIGRRRVE